MSYNEAVKQLTTQLKKELGDKIICTCGSFVFYTKTNVTQCTCGSFYNNKGEKL